ncbi:MAG: hypothetical protein VKP72_10650 [bacterium]|nr:hypothetical protein [bacterium]
MIRRGLDLHVVIEREGAHRARFVPADDRDLLVSSANLSPDAREVNPEVGLRVAMVRSTC